MAMAADAANFGRKRKRKRAAPGRKLTIGEKVEVRSEEDGFQGSWHPGTVTACCDQVRCVKYDHLLCNDGSDNLEDAVQVSPLLDGIGSVNANSCHYRGCIRPLPPHAEFNNRCIPYGMCVDVYYLDAWWEGVIFDHDNGSDERRIFFPDLGDELKTGLDMLRITQDWSEITENWQARGTWLFLELIEEYEQAGYLGVSVKQIWYDLRGKKGFQEIKEWTCTRRDLWKELMLEVIDESLNIILKDVLQFLDHSGGLSQEPSGQLESARTAADTSLEANLVNSHAIFPIENDLSADSLADQEKSVVHELISTLDVDGSDANILANSGVPCHNKAACLAAEPLSVLHSNPYGNSGTNSVTVREEFSSTNSDKTNGKPKHMTCRKTGNWLPVGPDIVPGAVFCPNAVSDYAHLTMNNRKPGNLLTTNVRKHLSYLGWKMEIKRGETINRLRYMSPDGEVYYSLRQVCQVRKVSTSEMIFSISDNHPSLHISPNNASSFSLLRQPEENWDPDFCSPTVVSPQSDELREKPECCPQAVVDYDMHGLHKSSKTPLLSLKDSLPKLKRRKASGPLPNLRGDLESSRPTCMLLSSKRVKQVVAPKSSHHNPRTVLSWLIDNNVVLPRAKVRYCSRKNFHSMAEGRITRDGIKCSCCEKMFTLSNFEVHAGSKYRRPAANIFLEDGRSLFDCQMQVIRGKKMGSYARKTRGRNKGTSHQGENDNICTVCHYGGELVLCDECPSAFHQGCINLKDVPAGDWFCPSCCCAICGHMKYRNNSAQPVDGSLHTCNQCEHKYHIGCLRNRGEDKLQTCPEEKWFCCKKCAQILLGLQKILGKPLPVGEDNLTWKLLKPMTPDTHDVEALSENHSKLNVALEVMHECFEPIKESRTQRDLVEDVIFSRGSELNRLNFQGFYTVLLERDDEIIAVATVRIHGEKVAEIPLIATRVRYRRRGMCRILMNELEKMLMELEVKRLVLPAIPSVLNTWTTSFGFTKMTDFERVQFLDFTFLDFPDTVMCQKLLRKNPSADSSPSGRQPDLVYRNRDNTDLDVSEVYQAEHNDESRFMEQELVSTARTNGCGIKSSVDMNVMVDQPWLSKTSQKCFLEDAHFNNTGRENSNFDLRCYKRRRLSSYGS